MLFINRKPYEIKTKKELENPAFQEILKNSYINKKKKIAEERIHCSCGCNLYTIQLKQNKKYYLRTYKYNKHKFECVFNADGIDSFVREEDGQIELKSVNLLFSKTRKPKKSSPEYQNIERQNKKSERKIKGFNHFLFVLSDINYAKSFNIVNKNSSRIDGNVINPDINLFSNLLLKDILNTRFSSSNKTVETVLKEKNSWLFVDVITKLTPFQELFYRYETINGNSYLVDKNTLYKGNRLARIYNNLIPPPYLLVKLASKKETFRFFIIPIVCEQYFIPVESQKERDYTAELISRNECVYKPMTTITIKQVLKKELAKNFYSIGLPDVRPDLFVFKKDKIEVIEIVDKNVLEKNESYKKRLETKEKAYSKLKEPFIYKRILT